MIIFGVGGTAVAIDFGPWLRGCAVEHILGARDYALVVGLPGAGKSATLAATVKALVDMGKSVLVTSHTHNAVDNILARLPDVGIDDFLRVGGVRD